MTIIKQDSISIEGIDIIIAVSHISCSEKVLQDAIRSSNSGTVIFTNDTGTKYATTNAPWSTN